MAVEAFEAYFWVRKVLGTKAGSLVVQIDSESGKARNTQLLEAYDPKAKKILGKRT